ncbi:MAG TPA: BON domain-containing protein [Longimicrobium sp.]|jgi:hypothetical protein
MARYDHAYRYPPGGRGPGPRDDPGREAAAREAYTPGGFGPEWLRRAGGSPYDGDFRPHGGRGGGAEFEGGRGVGAPWSEEEGTVYGPARYGLGPYYRRLQQRRRPDDELKQEVEEALFFDTWVDAESITVEVRDGIVTLRGELPDHEEVRYATDDAWDVDGVRGVRSELRVDSSKRKPLDWVGGKRESQGREGHGAGNG